MKKYIIIIFLYCSYCKAYAQGIISGNVIDQGTSEVLIGASISVVDTDIVAVTDDRGTFRLHRIPPGSSTLRITFIGYEPQSINIEVRDHETTALTIRMFPGDIHLKDIIISGKQNSINTLSPLDVKLRPTNTSQDILRMVPGLFIAQHAGGGKAEQIFLRGFDIDHGTDVNLQVDGLPVNMVSHAHGQGYSDLHFVIPEVINYVDFNKGPYYADKGDFTTAGYVEFHTKNYLDNNFVKLEGGQFGSARGVVGINFGDPIRSKNMGYVASEFFRSDGYVETPQEFNRFNITSKLSSRFSGKDQLVSSISFFRSEWDASGQIPTRAVRQGSISRFGSIDNTEGGSTMRSNLSVKHNHEFGSGGYFSQHAYAIHYDFNLYSNFTFFLNDHEQGDQIQQNESRMIYGYKAGIISNQFIFGKQITTETGIGVRIDDINDISLSHTIKRQFIADLQRGDINEINTNVFSDATLPIGDKWSVNTGLRLDYFRFSYSNKLAFTNRSVSKAVLSPKVIVNYQLDTKTQLYAKWGYGFHSNDARVVTPQNGKAILPKALGFDIGINSKLRDRLFVNMAIWKLNLDQEFVYVGDEGVVEPSGKTQREGIDLSIRYQLLSWLFVDTDVNLTKSKLKSVPSSESYIPLAPKFSSIGGLSFKMKNGLNGSFRYRYLGNRPANEDYSVVAKGYFLTDAIINYTRETFELGISVENIFNTKWNEAQFNTESRLYDESEPVSEIHFTPGTPLFLKFRFILFM